MTVNLDFTSVLPKSGGVGVVAVGVARGLRECRQPHEIVTTTGALSEWRAALPEHTNTIRAVSVALDAGSGWQVRLRRVIPRGRLVQVVIGAVRRVRARSSRKSFGEDATWHPFHRVPIASQNGVVTVHDLRVFEPALASTMDQRIIRENVARARAVVCSWPHPYRSLLERFPEAADKTFLIPLPVLNPGEPRGRHAPAGEFRILFPAFVTPHKNHEVVIRALALLPAATAVFTGSEDGSIGDDLRALAEELGVSHQIEWRGFVDADELEAEYARADLLVMPSKWEAASGPVFEAIVRELPFVASDIAPIRAQVEQLNVDAELFAPDSAEACAAAIRAAIDRYSQLVDNLRTIAPAVRGRSWRDTAAEYVRVFDWVAGRGPRPDDLNGGGRK